MNLTVELGWGGISGKKNESTKQRISGGLQRGEKESRGKFGHGNRVLSIKTRETQNDCGR